MWLASNPFKQLSGLILLSGLIAIVALPAQAEDTSLKTVKPELSDDFKTLMAEADMEKGASIFERKCSQCHDSAKDGGHGKGPHLWNVVGRKAGTAEGFPEYSDAMQGIGISWSLANLNYYLTNTKKAVPGRTMNFRGIRKDKDRAALIKFLHSLKDSSG